MLASADPTVPKALDAVSEPPRALDALLRLRRPPAGVTFRALRDGDTRDLFGLFNEPGFVEGAAIRDAFETEDDMRAWLAGIAAPNRFDVVAVASGTIVGYAGLYPLGGHMSHVGSIMLTVAAAAQARGIGGCLLQLTVLTAWTVAGLDKVALTVFTDNGPAVRLYTSAGFEIEGVLKRFARSTGRVRDAYAMALLL